MTPEIRIRRFPSGFIVEQLHGNTWVTCGTMELCQSLFTGPHSIKCLFSNLSPDAREFFHGSPVIEGESLSFNTSTPTDQVNLLADPKGPLEYFDRSKILYKFEAAPGLPLKPEDEKPT